MPRGDNNHRSSRGGFRGSRGSPRGGRGRGQKTRGRGRGDNGAREDYKNDLDFPAQFLDDGGNRGGRGRGGFARGRGRENGYRLSLDFPIQQWADESSINNPAGRGRGAPQSSPRPGAPRGRGRSTAYFRRGHGRGRGQVRPGPNTPLSSLLYQERPLLRPVIFVRSVHTATLFEQKEELFQPLVEDTAEDDASHVPTADRVTRVFSGIGLPALDDTLSDDNAEELEEIDFNDTARLREEIDTAPATILPVAEEQITGFFIDTNPTPFEESIEATRIEESVPLGGQEEPDEVIVYVAPHPRSGKVTPIPPSLTSTPLPTTSILTGTSIPRPISFTSIPETTVEMEQVQTRDILSSPPAFESISFSFASPSPKKQPRQAPVFTAGGKSKEKTKARKKEARVARRKAERKAMFGSFGAIMSEAQLRGVDPGRDSRWDERRRGDSDIDWGEEGDQVDDLSSAMGGMDLDPDLVIDVETMKTFAEGMGGQHVTIDDLADEERMRIEDEEDNESTGSSEIDDEIEREINKEEERMVDGLEGMSISDTVDADADDSSEDEEETPRSGFKARLERLRSKAQSRKAAKIRPLDDTSSDDENAIPTWADEEDDFFAEIDMILDDNAEVLGTGKRKKRNRLFQAIRDGDFDEVEGFAPARRRKDKWKDLPADLLDQWERDRAKKAEYKHVRIQSRLNAAADPFTSKKGGVKGRKAILKAAQLDPSITLLNRVVDMQTLEQQIWRFIANIGGSTTMALPPMDKDTRRMVHELAQAFGLSSKSKGKGARRYTTLSKTTRAGININERKAARIVGRKNAVSRPGGKGKITVPKHKDGDEVGKAAPKISESNVGFKMLALMGWSEGDRIGVSGGLDAPITAVIKNSKLGLGANR